MEYCKVSGCRYAKYHVTASHQCGKCTMFGHGQTECGRIDKMIELQKIHDHIPSKYACSKKGCLYPYLHTTEGHLCLYCGSRDDTHMKLCPIINSTCITDNALTDGLNITDKVEKIPIEVGHYIIMNAGMGCTWYIRNNNKHIEYFLMHSDSWGQYGDDTSDLPRLNCFLHSYIRQQ